MEEEEEEEELMSTSQCVNINDKPLRSTLHYTCGQIFRWAHLCVKLVVAEIEGGVDWLKRLKVDIDFFLLALLCHYSTTVHN